MNKETVSDKNDLLIKAKEAEIYLFEKSNLSHDLKGMNLSDDLSKFIKYCQSNIIQRPMKPELYSHTHEISGFVDYECPKCKQTITKEVKLLDTCLVNKVIEIKYCPYCGQKLDWSEGNE